MISSDRAADTHLRTGIVFSLLSPKRRGVTCVVCLPKIERKIIIKIIIIRERKREEERIMRKREEERIMRKRMRALQASPLSEKEKSQHNHKSYSKPSHINSGMYLLWKPPRPPRPTPAPPHLPSRRTRHPGHSLPLPISSPLHLQHLVLLVQHHLHAFS